jgi:hypothetical protein
VRQLFELAIQLPIAMRQKLNGISRRVGQIRFWVEMCNVSDVLTASSYEGCTMRHKDMVCVVTRAGDGMLRIRHYPTTKRLLQLHRQIGIDDCSTDLSLRGLPVFLDLIGPMPQSQDEARYESPEVFEVLTKQW